MITYASVVAFFVAYGNAEGIASDIEYEAAAALLDPFGMTALSIATRYWTVFQKNTQVLPLEGLYLWNRVLWVGVSLLILGFAIWRFQFATGSRKSRKKAARGYYSEYPLYLFAPVAVIATLVLALNLLGDSIRDAFDPKTRR